MYIVHCTMSGKMCKRVFILKSGFRREKIVWVVYEKEQINDMNIPVFLKNEMKDSLRLHVENSLESRIKFILKVKYFIQNFKTKLEIFEGLHVDMHGQKSTFGYSGRYCDLHKNRQSGRRGIFSPVERYQGFF